MALLTDRCQYLTYAMRVQLITQGIRSALFCLSFSDASHFSLFVIDSLSIANTLQSFIDHYNYKRAGSQYSGFVRFT